jgi:hypothetical protein
VDLAVEENPGQRDRLLDEDAQSDLSGRLRRTVDRLANAFRGFA